MIATILEDRCIACGICVEICPTDVFDRVMGTPPAIARVEDCQTCFACELYCPTDAIYVDPDCETPRAVDPDLAKNAPSFGDYRLHAGWGKDPESYPNEFWRMDLIFGELFEMMAKEGKERPR